METENNTTGTVQKPTIKERLQIFMQYAGQQIEWRRHRSHLNEPFGIIGFSTQPATEGIYFLTGKITRPELLHVSVLVKSLGKISKADKIHLLELFSVEDWLEYILHMLSPDRYPALDKVLYDIDCHHVIQEAIDFLREQGYALPYKNWSVEELEEFGIYKLVD